MLVVSGCIIPDKNAETPVVKTPSQNLQQCTEHSACASKVCDHYKKDLGNCAPKRCEIGEKTDNNNYYCNNELKWEKSKKKGTSCQNDFECFQQTCFMNPRCGLNQIPKASCEGGKCVLEAGPDPCGVGMSTALRKDQYNLDQDGNCQESMAQMVLPTVCIKCGDSICDEETESECNCPKDCRSS